MDAETQKLVDDAVAKARAEFALELAATKSALERWVNAHPVLAFRVGVVLGILGGGGSVFTVLHFLG